MAPAGSTRGKRQNFATCVDARFGARRIFWIGAARGRMLPSVRPWMRLTRRRPGWEMLWGERRGAGIIGARQNRRSGPMPQLNDQSRSHTVLKQDSTLIAVLEMSQSAWLVAGLVPGIERHPLKKIEPDEAALLRLLRRWQEEATQAGHPITRITLAFEAGRDGFWLARWLRAHGIEAHVTAWCTDRLAGAEELSGVGERPLSCPWMPIVPFKL